MKKIIGVDYPSKKTKAGLYLELRTDQEEGIIGGSLIRTLLRIEEKEGLKSALQGTVDSVLVRWAAKVNSKIIPSTVKRVLYARRPSWLSKASIQVVPLSATQDFDYEAALTLPGDSRDYGIAQELGREEGRAKAKKKYYMVPVSGSWSSSKYWGKGGVRKELENRKGIFWAPRGKNKYWEDSLGRPAKFVFQIKNSALASRYEQGFGGTAKGLSKLEKKRIEKIRELAKERGVRLTKARQLRSWAKILFIAYPRSTPSPPIPGTSSVAKARDKTKNVYNAPHVMTIGIGRQGGKGVKETKGRGPGEASRWFSRAMADGAKDLIAMLNNDRFRRGIRAAMLAQVSRGRRTAAKSGAYGGTTWQGHEA